STFAQSLFGNIEGAARACHDFALQALTFRRLPDRVEGILDIRKGRDDRLAVGLQKLILPALLQVEVAEQPAAFEDRLCQAGREREEGRLRPQQRPEDSALIAAFA